MRFRAARSIKRRITALLSASLLLGLVTCAPAGADVFGSISLVSASPFQQVEYAHDPTISGDGSYVVFDGSIGGVTGVWRRDLATDELEQVAGGDAELPSVSENGQYVSFTTNEGGKLPEITDGLPDSSLTEEAPNVYVRDMSKAPSEEGAFTLASNLSYEYPVGENRAFDEKHYGAEAAGRTALSADGQKVAFVTTAASNLDGPGTPPLQVAVHDLKTGKTELVSVEYDRASGRPATNGETGQPEPVPVQQEGSSIYGAVYTYGGPPIFRPPTKSYELQSEIGASISGDGSTVAWMGQNIGEQAQTLPEESVLPRYGEPLWRRIVGANGEPSEEASTRRVTGGSDPANPACVASAEKVLPVTPSLSDPCQGPFATTEQYGVWSADAGETVPRLSADGYTVAFLANAPLVSLGADFGANSEDRGSDAYVAGMHEGISRVQALTPLTELASGEETRIATNAPILDLGISSDGSQVAFTTKRIVFPLGSLTYVSAPAAIPGLNELFDVDLADDTLTRVTHGYEGGPSEHPHEGLLAGEQDEYRKQDDGSLSPSFSTGGDLLAFSSTASNLVYGDGNTPPLNDERTDGSDAFVLPRTAFSSAAAPQVISAAPPSPPLTPLWGLGVTALSLADGSVRLYVELPAAGTLGASASSPVKVRLARSARRARRGASKASRVATVLTRTVATAMDPNGAADGGLTMLELTLAPSYRALAARRGGLSATANLTFTAPGHPALHQSIAVSFLRVAPKRPVSKKPVSRRSRAAVPAHSKTRGHRGR